VKHNYVLAGKPADRLVGDGTAAYNKPSLAVKCDGSFDELRSTAIVSA
jgi:hypothetical protein